ncbi:histidine kinase [Halovulum dunhuangense]|uniref:Histidine kinase n=1 Tax=Halovulum dunhuangense TaxID=1505036 RepID=A0A849L792_9RHOB|nr:ATP-binding protein [Halovulum dunhuangense]NNU82002.1 histidine kinase [Halovulum dunhuangense]
MAPAPTLLGAVLAGLVLALAMVILAARQPWLGLELGADPDSGAVQVRAADPSGPAASLPPGTRILALAGAGERILPGAVDLVEEPDTVDTYAAMNDVFARQRSIARILQGQEITLEVVAEPGQAPSRVAISPAPYRPLSDLPAIFWLQLAVGLTGFWLGAWIWSLQRGQWPARFLALAGTGLMISALTAAVYSGRELALGGATFRLLSGANHAGTLLFGVGMIGLFLCYPHRLVGRRALALPAIVLGAWLAVDQLQLVEGPPLGIHLPIVLSMATILVLVGIQYRVTRGDLVARTSLTWLGLSVAIGSGAFVALVIMPNLLGLAPILSQGVGFVFFLLIYMGVALGVARFRLFLLDEWAFRTLFYVGGVLLLLGVDAIFVYVVLEDRVPAFALSLVLVGCLYLPMRDAIGRRFLHRSTLTPARLFRDVVDIALTPPGADQIAGWHRLLAKAFDPLRITPCVPQDRAALAAEGLALVVPGAGPVPALRLEHASGGRRLFSPRDVEFAAEICAMLRDAMESRRAYEKGVAEERARIARDIHDNIGIQLMGALHSVEPESKNRMICDSLSDLRDIISNATGRALSLDEMLADLRVQIADQLEASGLALDWQVAAGGQGALPLQLTHALRSVIREAVHNAIRHAGASRVTIRLSERHGAIALGVTDDGTGWTGTPRAGGNGMANMHRRAEALGGRLQIRSGRDGTTILVELPLLSRGQAA